MQSSGVGNCINMMSLVQECRFPLLMIVTMRGEWGETNPWQVPMGQSTPAVLERAGVIVHRVDIRKRSAQPWRRPPNSRSPPAVLSPSCWGSASSARSNSRSEMSAPFVQLDRREAVKVILRDRGDALVVTGLGSPTWDVASAGDSPLNFYLWGAMGGAAMLGLGLALAQRQRRVLVVTGDGEMLMGFGSLATIGPERPPNLSIVILDNESYGETGMQQSHTGRGVDLAAIARGAAFPYVTTVSTRPQLDEWLPTLPARPDRC